MSRRIKWRVITGLVIIGVVLAIAAYDLSVLLIVGPEATWSWVLRDWAQTWGMLPYLLTFAAGLIIGHTFLYKWSGKE